MFRVITACAVRRKGLRLLTTLRVPYTATTIGPEEEAAVVRVLRSGRLVMGPEVQTFEAHLQEYVGRRHAIAVASGTAALQMALALLEVGGPRWTVFVPAYTWVATYNVAYWAGCRVVPVDVRADTFCMDMSSLARAIARETQEESGSPRAMAVLPVHMFGYRCGQEEDEIAADISLESLARRHDLTVIGDACCAFASVSQTQRCGSWTPVECTSFHPRKVITTGEGGAVFTDSDFDAAFCRSFRDHGAVRSASQRAQTTLGGPDTPLFAVPGLNLRPTEMQGAIGVVQMGKVVSMAAQRREIAARYTALLAQSTLLSRLFLPPIDRRGPGDELVLTAYPLLLHRAEWGTRRLPVLSTEQALAQRTHLHVLQFRDSIMQTLAGQGISLRPPMISLLDVDYIRRSPLCRPALLPESVLVRALTVGLPIFPGLTPVQQELVVASLEAACLLHLPLLDS